MRVVLQMVRPPYVAPRNFRLAFEPLLSQTKATLYVPFQVPHCSTLLRYLKETLYLNVICLALICLGITYNYYILTWR